MNNNLIQNPFAKRFHNLSILLASIPIIISMIVIFGWIFDYERMTTLMPDLASMKFNTALLFLLSSLSIFVSQKAKHLKNMLVISIFLIASLTLSQYIFQINFGIDQLFVMDISGSDYPGRMSIATSINFILISVGIFLLLSKSDLSFVFAGLTALSALVALSGYLHNVEVFYAVPIFSSMALHTAISFFVLSVATILADDNGELVQIASGDTAGSKLIRIMNPTILLSFFLITSIFNIGNNLGFYPAQFSSVLTNTTTLVLLLLAIFYLARQLHQIDKERQVIQSELFRVNSSLEKRVKDRTRDLEHTNEQLHVYHSAVVSSSEMISVINKEHRYTMANEVYIQYYQPNLHNLIGYHIQDIVGIDDYDTQIKDRLNRSLNGEEQNFELATYFPEKGLCHLWVSYAPIRNNSQEVTDVVIVMRDITERKNMENSLIEAKEAADTANRAKSIFLANMSHELRTPLNAIMGFTQLLERDDTLSQEQVDQTLVISNNAEHLLELINDILELSRIEANKLTLHLQPTDLHQLILDINKTMELFAESKGISFISNLDKLIPQHLQLDTLKLRQVLINLINNAIKFTDVGEVSLYIYSKDDNLYFEIQDSGAGIEAEAISGLFEMFTQSKSGLSAEEGAGLGLPISQRLIQLMGGDIKISSEVDTGTLISFNIPYDTSDLNQATVNNKHTIIGIQNQTSTHRILIVDDHQESCLLVAGLLEPIGFDTKTASNGNEALSIVKEWKPDLIFMDLNMPVMDGLTATNHIRKLHLTNKPLIVAITAGAFEHQKQDILEAGCDDFIPKPFNLDIILDKIQHHLKVEYKYAEEKIGDITISNHQFLRTLADVPKEFRTKLLDHVRALDTDNVLILLETIKPSHPELASEIELLINDFRFDVIRHKLEKLD